MHMPSNQFTECLGQCCMKQCLKNIEGTVPILNIWVYCITTSKYLVLYHLTKSRNIVYSPTVQFKLSMAVSDLHFVFSACYSDAL